MVINTTFLRLHWQQSRIYHHQSSPKMMIDGDKYDFVANEDARRKVINAIDQKLIDIGNLN